MPRRSAASISSEEIAQFSRHAEDWWNPDGVFRPLHKLNPVRLAYIRDQACAHFGRDSTSRHSLKGLKVLDVGCGGGLLTEPLARLGGQVTGLDASREGIAVARAHAKAAGLKIDYRVGSVEGMAARKGSSPLAGEEAKAWAYPSVGEDKPLAFAGEGLNFKSNNPSPAKTKGLAKAKPRFSLPLPSAYAKASARPGAGPRGSFSEGGQGERKDHYDLITALEIVEHVADLDSFISSLAPLLKPDGLLIMSTLNRTAKSFALGIVAAEYILGWVPKGTHQWKKFLRPSELVGRLEKTGIRTTDLTGLVFNPLRGEFELSASDLGVNYMLAGKRI